MTPQEQEAFARGRLQGLEEMNDAWVYRALNDSREIEKLRQEYQKPN